MTNICEKMSIQYAVLGFRQAISFQKHFFKKWAIPALFSFIFVFSVQLADHKNVR